MKIGVLLSGCGVYDGAEIHESVLSLLAIAEQEAEAVCIGINRPQRHVINHLVGEEMAESRNMLIEAARIARGDIRDITTVTAADIDGLVIPGGFGSAKNFTDWAIQGPAGEILPEVKRLVLDLVELQKPIAALCVSPVVIAKALEGTGKTVSLTLGSDQHPTPYDLAGFAAGLEATGMVAVMKTKDQIEIDPRYNIISAPCYMMETDLPTLRNNITAAIKSLVAIIKQRG
jgi:enhancing lycopene biosynthesis protein 2